MIQQRSIRKIKNNLIKQEYSRFYPTRSSPGKFYGTTKRRKLKKGSSVNNLPLRPIISNVATASYQLAKVAFNHNIRSIVPKNLLK